MGFTLPVMRILSSLWEGEAKGRDSTFLCEDLLVGSFIDGDETKDRNANS
jgi:hypothetical protein